MANFYNDNPALRLHLNHPLMKKIVELKERNFADADKYDYAPRDFEDAMDSYDKVLDIVGEICGDVIAENAEDVDHQGPRVENGHVVYADGTARNLDVCRKAGLMGMSMPRRLGGLNFPITPYIMAADIVSRADAGFENLWGLQDCAETIYEFASDEQKEKYIPRVCAGETMSMDLTEPDAGSDLQSVMLKATQKPDGQWVLNGVKRFITNGDSDIHLVLARSEEGSRDGRGLSMFIYDKRNGGVTVRRIENKMGIKGSPTCELVYKDAPVELCGSRRLGLIKYVMALMNGARLGIAAQSVGLCEAAYREALQYAKERRQFGKAIIEFPAVAEILSVMKAKLDAGRALLYACSRYVDMYKVYDDIAKERPLTLEEKKEAKAYSRLADAFTPLAKGMTSEFCNQNAYDAIQIHGGSGFMKDYACERIYRDSHVTTGTYLNAIRDMEQKPVDAADEKVKNTLVFMTQQYAAAVESVEGVDNPSYRDFMARRLVEMAGHIIMGYLLLDETQRDDSFRRSLNVYVNYGQAEVAKHADFIGNFLPEELKDYTY